MSVIYRLRGGNMDECTVLLGTVYCCIRGREQSGVAAPGVGTRTRPTSGPQLARNNKYKERHEMTDTQVTWLTQELSLIHI